MNPTLSTRHGNILIELVDELEREGREAKRRADATFERLSSEEELTDERYATLAAQAGRDRGIQDAHANIVGRLRSVLIAPLSCIVDVGEVFDEVEARLGGRDATSSPKPVTPATAARIAAEVIDGRNVRGARP